MVRQFMAKLGMVYCCYCFTHINKFWLPSKVDKDRRKGPLN